MPDIGEVVETTWGEVIVGDLIVSEAGVDWRVSERAEDGTVTCINTKSGAALANTPHPAKAVKIRPRVSVRHAVETIANAFPDATVGASLADARRSVLVCNGCDKPLDKAHGLVCAGAPKRPDTRAVLTCETCGAWVTQPRTHRSWHEALADRLADLDARTAQILLGMN